MMRFVGNTFAKSCRMGMQYRGFSSGTAVPIGKKVVDYCFIGAFGAAGYVLSGLKFPPVSKNIQEMEERIISYEKILDDKIALFEGRKPSSS